MDANAQPLIDEIGRASSVAPLQRRRNCAANRSWPPQDQSPQGSLRALTQASSKPRPAGPARAKTTPEPLIDEMERAIARKASSGFGNNWAMKCSRSSCSGLSPRTMPGSRSRSGSRHCADRAGS